MATTKTRSKASKTGRARKSSTRRVPVKKKARTASRLTKRASNKKEQANGSLLHDFFLEALKDIYGAEKALTKALPKMSKESTSSDLKKAFNEHLAVTRKQIERLELVFKKLGKKVQSKKCDAMEGLIEESETIMMETKDDTSTKDAALIIAAQKVEHYEIATYGGLVQLARTMKKNDIAKILNTTLNEEKKADVLLTKIAEKGGVNEEASNEPAEQKTSLKDNIISIFSKKSE
ncbi:MAG TPA: ferritin-like domain-containing protein [Chryseosolibacter sp.]|nr:ferritin-like domain-containing protein [Chryseosolibacter sp.]